MVTLYDKTCHPTADWTINFFHGGYRRLSKPLVEVGDRRRQEGKIFALEVRDV